MEKPKLTEAQNAPVVADYSNGGEACSVFLSEETRDQLRELAQKTALGFDKLVAQAVARMVSDQSAASYGKSPFTSKKSPRKSKRRNSALSSSSGGVSGVNKRRASSGRQSKGAATEPSARDEGRLSRWHELPDPIVRAIHQTLQAHAPGHVRASMLRVCRAWAQQFSLMVTEAPFGLGIHKRQCDWQLCSLDGVSSVARYRNLRMLSLGIHRLPAQRLPAVLARLSRLEMLDLHFPPNFHPTSAEHHRCLAALTVPSLGLQLRSFMLSVSQLNMLQKLPNLHRLCYKLHRMQTTSSTIRAHTSALLAFTQLQELGLRINMEGQAATTEGCLDPLTALTCLTSLKIRTFREVLDVDRDRKLGALPCLTSLRHLDVDGFTDLKPTEMAQLSSLTRLETLLIRNSSYLHACDLTSLSALTSLKRLDFSLHAEYKDLAEEEGEDTGPEEPWTGQPWEASDPLSSLASLKGLQDLDLGHRTSLLLGHGLNLYFLTELTLLTKLNLKHAICTYSEDNQSIRGDLKPLCYLHRLQSLNLEGCPWTGFDCLACLPHLRHLCLRNCGLLRDEDVVHLASNLPSLCILDVAECHELTSSSIHSVLRARPMMWAISLPGQTIDLRTVELLQRLRELSHVVVTRPSRATLEGVNAGDLFGELGERKRRVAGEMVRRYLRAELPGKLREHAMFYRSGYLDYPEWDSWWMTVDQYDDAMSDRDLSDSETDASDYISDEDMMDSGTDQSDNDDDEDDDFLANDQVFMNHAIHNFLQEIANVDDDSEETDESDWSYSGSGSDEDSGETSNSDDGDDGHDL